MYKKYNKNYHKYSKCYKINKKITTRKNESELPYAKFKKLHKTGKN